MRAVRSLLALATAVLALACGAPADPVDALLQKIEAAVDDRDADEVTTHLSPEFRGGDAALSRAATNAELRRYFFAYDSVDLTLSDVTRVAIEGGTEVSLRADFSGHAKNVGGLAGLLPSLAAFRFQLLLAPQDGGLAVREASWQRIDVEAPAAQP